jgi:phosphate transport system substrate-binding protein
MKENIIAFTICILVIMSGCTKNGNMASLPEQKGTITLSGAWALYPLALKWAGVYQNEYPGVRVEVSAGGAGKGISDVLSGVVDIGNVSRDLFPQEIEKGAWHIAIARDAVVPTCNNQNPHIEAITSTGMTKSFFQQLWLHTNTGEGITKNEEDMIAGCVVYTRSDACGAAQVWAGYLGGSQEDLIGIGVYGDPGLAEAVQKDIYGIGYNNINYAFHPVTGKPFEGLTIIPMDLNENHRIDPGEDFYHTRDELIYAISQNIYPSPPARLLYFVCRGVPEKPLVRDFILWVLSIGQDYVEETGYIPVDKNILEEGRKKLYE